MPERFAVPKFVKLFGEVFASLFKATDNSHLATILNVANSNLHSILCSHLLLKSQYARWFVASMMAELLVWESQGEFQRRQQVIDAVTCTLMAQWRVDLDASSLDISSENGTRRLKSRLERIRIIIQSSPSVAEYVIVDALEKLQVGIAAEATQNTQSHHTYPADLW